ncbi:hypothetical protein VP01_1159g7, partial [Puccinia sorghi]
MTHQSRLPQFEWPSKTTLKLSYKTPSILLFPGSHSPIGPSSSARPRCLSETLLSMELVAKPACCTLIGINTMQHNLVHNLLITLKKPDTVNIRKSLAAKMADVPTELLIPPWHLSWLPTQCQCSLIHLFTLVTGISYHGVLSMSVAEHNFKACDFKHFLKWKLVSPPIWSSSLNECVPGVQLNL